MTSDEFRQSLTKTQPPSGLGPALLGLWDATGDWTRAHQSAQQNEGREGTWVHAYLRRKEEDRGQCSLLVLSSRQASLPRTIRYGMDLHYERIAGVVAGGPMAFDPNIGVATRWKKGQPSPNPGGRPKSRLLSEALRTRLAEVKPGDQAGRTYAEIIAENLIEIASSDGPGAVNAANEVSNRVEGRARQSIEIADITADLRNKSDEELRFHLQYDRWPTDEELSLLREPVEPTEM